MSATTGIRRAMRDAMDDAVMDLARDIMAAAREDAPPSPPPDEDPAPEIKLREAGYIQALPDHGVEIGFDTRYAAKQHEDLRLEHPRGGTPKFLERHVAAAAAQLEGRIAIEVRKAMARSARRPTGIETTRLG